MTTIDSTRSSNKKYLVTGAAVIAVAVAPTGSAGFIRRSVRPRGPLLRPGAMCRRRSARVTSPLGDTSIPQLMQTDAFEVMSKNPSFRTLAGHPGFAALAQNSAAMAAIAANPQAFTGLAKIRGHSRRHWMPRRPCPFTASSAR